MYKKIINFFSKRHIDNDKELGELAFTPSTFSMHECLFDLPIVSLDFETTGLNLMSDDVVSIGLVELSIKNSVIDLATAWHQIIDPKRAISAESVTIHQINDTTARQGISIEQALPILMEKIHGKILLVHCQSIESAFLNKYFNRHYQKKYNFQYIDTMELARQYGAKNGRVLPGLRLYHLHEHYGMPAYPAHNALMDAITTAEVFFAQINDYFIKDMTGDTAKKRKRILLKDVIYAK